jgi:hypothetical protein
VDSHSQFDTLNEAVEVSISLPYEGSLNRSIKLNGLARDEANSNGLLNMIYITNVDGQEIRFSVYEYRKSVCTFLTDLTEKQELINRRMFLNIQTFSHRRQFCTVIKESERKTGA